MGNNWEKVPDKTLTSYIKFVKHYSDYITISDIKLKIFAKVNRIYKSPKENNLYIPKEFGNENDIEIIFDGNYKIDFVSTEYIEKYLNSDSEDAKTQKNSWKNFLKKLGAIEFPPIVPKDTYPGKSAIEARLKEKYPNDTVCDTTYTNSYNGYRLKDYAFPDYLTSVIDRWINEKVFLFNWNEIPGNDDDKIINFLEKSQCSIWVKNPRIEKINDGREISISDGKNSFSLFLNNEKTKAVLKNDQGLTQEFIVKTENGTLNLYENPCRKLKILMQIIHDRWSEYSKYTESKYLYHVSGASGWNDARLGLSSFGKFLKRANWAPTVSGKHLKPSAVFLNSKDISSVEYKAELVDCQLENEKFIKFIELQTEPSLEGSIKYLDGLVNSKEKDIEAFRKIYVYIYNFLKIQNSETKFNIIKKFDDIPFIYTPNYEKEYRTISEVTWHSSPVLLNWKVGIEKYYYGLEEFFVGFLNVKKNAEFEDFIQFLTRYLWKRESLNEKEKDTLKRIYLKLNERLDERLDGNDFSNSEYWKKLKTDFKFWCENNRWVSANKEIFYNDNSELYAIFSNDNSLNILYASQKEDLSALINTFKIKSLSKSVEEIYEPIGESEDITAQNRDKIIRLIPSIAGFIRQKSKPTYTEFLNEGLFNKIFSIKIYNVQDFSLKIKLESSRIVKIDKTKPVVYSLRENCLYLKMPFESSQDNIAIEISKFFNNIEGLADFIALIIDKPDERIKKILENRKIDEVTELLEPESPPVTPEQPEPPESPPETPEQPESPESPPETPEQPESPESPPVTPEQPEPPESPPETSEQPESPESPPETPEQPELPESPPEAPKEPELPESPPEALKQPEMTPTLPLKTIKEEKVRNSELAKWAKENYGYHCQICLAREKPEFLSYQKSYSGRLDNRKALMRGHHIKRLSKDEGHDHPGNYLSLCHFHHQIIHKIGFKLEDLEFSLDYMEKIPIKWPNGEEVNWFLITFSNKFKENGFAIKLVIAPPHLEQIKKYIGFLKM